LKKILITYFIFCKSVTQSYLEFQIESNFNIFKKYTIEELYQLEKNIIDCYNKNYKMINKYVFKNIIEKEKKIEIKLQNYEHPMMPIASHDYICNMYLKKQNMF